MMIALDTFVSFQITDFTLSIGRALTFNWSMMYFQLVKINRAI